MNDLVKRKKTLPVALAFEQASQTTRAELETLFAAAAPLEPESVERIREILDELGVRAQVEREIGEHRERALGILRGTPGIARGEALDLLERLVRAATGAGDAATAVVA